MILNYFKYKKELTKIKECLKKLEEYKKKSLVSDEYLLINTKYCEKTLNEITEKAIKKKDSSMIDFYCQLIQEWDNYGKIPLDLGKRMESLINDENLEIGIHRTGGYGMIDPDCIESSEVLYSIFKDGLFITGDLFSGVDHRGEVIQPNKNISPLLNIIEFVIFAKTSYKYSTGGVVTAIPKEYVTSSYEVKDGCEKKLFINVDGQWTLKPEFLIGFITQKKGICNFYTKEEVLKLCEDYQNKFRVK